MPRKFYLEDIPLEEAWAAFRSALQAADLWPPPGSETIPLDEARDRVTSEAVWARLSSPHYHASAMDGYAVRAASTTGATETRPLALVVIEDPEEGIDRAAAVPVNTGHPLPAGTNAVIMIENTQPIVLGDGTKGIEIRQAVPPWHHVRPMGEDIVATELVLPANHRLRPVDLGALAAAGHSTVSVYRRPRVAVIPTGSELVSIGSGDPKPGQIIEFNSLVLAAQVENWGGIATRWPVVADDFETIQQAVGQATTYDLILLNAGSSAGSEDYTAAVVESLGQLLVHGVAVRPGHPVVLGMINGKDGSAVPLIGVPGYPVSAAITGELFTRPLLAQWQGQTAERPATMTGQLTRKTVSPTGDDDFVRVAVGKVDDRLMVTPLSRGAGVITSLVRADGLIRIPRFSEGADAGSTVTVHLYRTPEEIERTIVAIGSHDLTLDMLSDNLAARYEGLRLTSANVGSLGGLIALSRGQAHLAGSHLLDPETGDYNRSYIRRYLPDEDVVVVRLAGREQGWIVPAGNPRQLSGWEDASRPDIRLANRQRGAGTRVLLDYELDQRGIDPAAVQGYDREEYTHLAVAAAVASGAADFGLGIRAAAQALNLDFVPLAYEPYELIIPRRHYESPHLQPLLALLQDENFQAAVAARPGYDVAGMGDVREL